MFIKVDVPRRLVKHLGWRRLLPDASLGLRVARFDRYGRVVVVNIPTAASTLAVGAMPPLDVGVFSYSQLWQHPQPVWYLLSSNAAIAGGPGIVPRTVGVSVCLQLRCPVSVQRRRIAYPIVQSCTTSYTVRLQETSYGKRLDFNR